MADITDIKTIMYTEKSLALQEAGVIVVQTTPKMTKNGLREVFKEFFGISPLRINSMRVNGKVKRFKGIQGKRNDVKKFYVKLPEDAKIESLAV
ncbi:MAG: 50S ribosomal protein L23 [Sulfurovaceae bacterium]|jgi:large subunit ribosomal protein L23|nr:50S ribosomal protein L23 [Campylobacterales bacterium]MDD3775064.1 50S ribosomal protein L23 [Sulfurovaceae bacterium]MDY0195736.1 50S ribosomal protein L23 [Sulfurovaceae bacterium]